MKIGIMEWMDWVYLYAFSKFKRNDIGPIEVTFYTPGRILLFFPLTMATFRTLSEHTSLTPWKSWILTTVLFNKYLLMYVEHR